MNVLREKVPPLNYETDTTPPKKEVVESKVEVVPVQQTAPPVETQQKTTPHIEYDAHAFAPPKEAPKGKAKKQLSEKQAAHLARIRAKALAAKAAKREAKEKAQAEKRAEKLLAKEERELEKAQRDDERSRRQKAKDDEAFYARMDSWYERKQAKKQAKQNVAKKTAPVSGGGGNVVKPVPQKPAYRNPNSKYDPFSNGFTGSGRRKIDQFGRFTF
tara:strand:- start:27 stop:674 length:648 start_codon:yes stop_codon:yes gene_type:complete